MADSAISSFIQMMQAERAAPKNTIESYTRDLTDLADFLKDKGLETASESDITAYMASLSKRGMAASTLARRSSAIRQFYRFLHAEGLRKDNPASKLRTPKQAKSLPKYLTMDEVERLFRTTHEDDGENGLRLAAMLELLYASGLRVSELIALKASAFQRHKDDKGRERYFLRILGKGNKERLVPLHQAAIDAVEAYHHIEANKNSYLFPSPRSGSGHITRQRVGQLLKGLALKANIDPKRLSPHVMRHSFATHLLERGMDLRVLQELLGHANIVTTQVYTHISNEQLYTLVSEVHPLAK